MKTITEVSSCAACNRPEWRLNACLFVLLLTGVLQAAEASQADQELTELSRERKASTTEQSENKLKLVTIRTRLAIISDMLAGLLLAIGAPGLGGIGGSRAASKKSPVTKHAFNTLAAALAGPRDLIGSRNARQGDGCLPDRELSRDGCLWPAAI